MTVRGIWLAAALWLVTSAAIASPKGRSHEHVVQPGQRLGSIAKRYHVSVQALCEANDLANPNLIRPGRRLVIPDASKATKPSKDAQDAASASHQSPSKSKATRTVGTTKADPDAATSYGRYLRQPAHKGSVHLIGYHGEWKGRLVSRRGSLLRKASAAASRVLAWPHRDYVMNKRLLRLLAKVSDAFGGRPIRVVSGYRTTSWVSESKHPLGRACDFSVIGVPNEALRDYLRTLGPVGVGYYPNSSFVHLDVREQATYWIDYAGPGEPPRLHPRPAVARQDQSKESSELDHGEPTDATDATDASDDSETKGSDEDAATDNDAGHSPSAAEEPAPPSDRQDDSAPKTDAKKAPKTRARSSRASVR